MSFSRGYEGSEGGHLGPGKRSVTESLGPTGQNTATLPVGPGKRTLTEALSMPVAIAGGASGSEPGFTTEADMIRRHGLAPGPRRCCAGVADRLGRPGWGRNRGPHPCAGRPRCRGRSACCPVCGLVTAGRADWIHAVRAACAAHSDWTAHCLPPSCPVGVDRAVCKDRRCGAVQ